jgi:Secretion system C-terminal sorting domain
MSILQILQKPNKQIFLVAMPPIFIIYNHEKTFINMKKHFFTFALSCCAIFAQAQNFTAGNIVGTLVGDGTAAGIGATAPVSIVQYSPSGGAATKTLALPGITVPGTTTQAGQISLSTDGKSLQIIGNTTATNGKAIANVSGCGATAPNYATTLTSTNGPRSVVSQNGSAYWESLSGGGVGYEAAGGTAATTVYSSTTPRTLNIYGNQLYMLNGFGNLVKTSPALPTAAGATASTAVLLSPSLSSNGFIFFDLDPAVNSNNGPYDVVYVTNSKTNGNTVGGLEKFYWDTVSQNWVAANTQFNTNINMTSGGSCYTTAPTVKIGQDIAANTAYTVGQQLIGTDDKLYEVITAGTSGTAPFQPAATPVVGTTFTSGGVTFRYLANSPSAKGTAILGTGATAGQVVGISYTIQQQGSVSSTVIAPPLITIAAPPAGAGCTTATAVSVFPNNPFAANGLATGGLAQLTGEIIGGVPVLYATTGSGNSTNNSIIAITDNSGRTGTLTNATAPSSTVATAGINNAFRGVALSPSSVGCSMPVKLTYFNGSLLEGDALLKWETASEVDVREMIVEKSTDVVNFKAVGTVVPSNSNQGSRYELMDKNLSEGIQYYYRLKSVDLDGTFEYSRIIALRRELSEVLKLKVFPNPVANYVTVSYPTVGEGSVLRVFDVLGREILKKELAVGSNQFGFDSSSFINGTYVISVSTQNKVITSRLIK